MRSFSFNVVGIPLAWPRAEVTANIIRVGGRLKAVGKIYVPETDDIKKFKHDVAFEGRKAFNAASEVWEDKPPLETPVAVNMLFVFPATKAMSKKKKGSPREWMANKPDLDNLEKAILDALNKVVYNDDRQVCQVFKEKVYGAPSEAPMVRVEIEPLPKYIEFYKEQNGGALSIS